MWHTTERLGENQALTPEGFLVARNVPIARTGTQLYSPTELALAQFAEDAGGAMIPVVREPREVFSPRAIASFEGKPVTLAHATSAVTPETFASSNVVGHVQNVRRGDPPDDHLLLGDLLIHDPAAIRAIRSGARRSVSCGYDARYARGADGRLRQTDITGNHLALLREVEAAHRTADTTAQRATAHLADCRAELRTFEGIDAEVEARTIAALRDSDLRPRVDLPDALRERITRRDQARVTASAAGRAALKTEADQARAQADQARRAVRGAAAAVAGGEAERMAWRFAELAEEQNRIIASLAGCDMALTAAGTRLPASAASVLLGHGRGLLRRGDAGAWDAVIEVLCDDSDAPVSIELVAVDTTRVPIPRAPECSFTLAVPVPDDEP